MTDACPYNVTFSEAIRSAVVRRRSMSVDRRRGFVLDEPNVPDCRWGVE